MTPHFNLEIEQSAIGAVLLEPYLVEQADFKPSLFFDPLCRKTCEKMLEMIKAKQSPDIISLSSKGLPVDKLFEIQSKVEQTASFPTWLEILSGLHYKRELQNSLSDMQNKLSDVTVAPDALKTALAQSFGKMQSSGANKVIGMREKLATLFDCIKSSAPMLYPVNYRASFAQCVEHYKGQVHTAGGMPGIGKTALALSLLDAMIPYGRCALICKESAYQELMARLISQRSGVPACDIMRGGLLPQQAKRAAQALMELSQHGNNWTIIGMGEFTASIEGVRDAARRWAYEAGGIDFLVIDYIQALGKADGEGLQQQEIFTRVGHTMEGISSLTEELNCGTMALSQLNRDSRKVKGLVPGQTSFMGASEIEFNSHIMSVLYREGDDSDRVRDGVEVYPTWWKAVKTRLVKPFCRQIGFKASNQQYVSLDGFQGKTRVISSEFDPEPTSRRDLE